MSDADRGRVTLAAFGQCIVSRYRLRVDRALAMNPMSKDYVRAMKALADPECLRSGEMSMPSELMRGAIYRGLYRIDFWQGMPGLAPKPIDFASDVANDASSEAQGFVVLHRFADCVVRSDPAHARELELATVTSAAEANAFASLSPALNTCLVAGQTLRFTRVMLTGLISEAIYREAEAASATAPAHGGRE